MNTLKDLFTKKSSLDNFMISKLTLKTSGIQQSDHDNQFSMPSKLSVIDVNCLLKSQSNKKLTSLENHDDLDFLSGVRDAVKNGREERRKQIKENKVSFAEVAND